MERTPPATPDPGPSSRRSRQRTSSPLWTLIPALLFTTLLLGFLIVAYFFTPNMTPAQENLARLLFALLTGFSTAFLGGTILLRLEARLGEAGTLTVSAVAGVAMFVFTYVWAPYWYAKTTPSATPAPLYKVAFNQFRSDTKSCVQLLSQGQEFHIIPSCYHTQ